MTERPILFSAPMVRALLDGRKTQTRRIVKPSPVEMVQMVGRDDLPTGQFGLCLTHGRVIDKYLRCPYGVPGDLLWARERWATWMHAPSLPEGLGGALSRDPGDWLYAATDPEWDAMDHDRRALKAHNARSEDGRAGNYVIRNSIHMPRWASRITLRVTDVRVERLNEISHDDCWAEGVVCPIHGARKHTCCSGLTRGYRDLWNSINGAGSWDENPWVWALSFERVEQVQRSAA